jgi:hypothetical protein
MLGICFREEKAIFSEIVRCLPVGRSRRSPDGRKNVGGHLWRRVTGPFGFRKVRFSSKGKQAPISFPRKNSRKQPNEHPLGEDFIEKS